MTTTEAALRQALERYGRHKESCNVARALPFERRGGAIQCTCGFDDAKAAQPSPASSTAGEDYRGIPGGYAAVAKSDLIAEASKLPDDFPNYGDWPVSLPAGHWRAIMSALSPSSGEPASVAVEAVGLLKEAHVIVDDVFQKARVGSENEREAGDLSKRIAKFFKTVALSKPTPASVAVEAPTLADFAWLRYVDPDADVRSAFYAGYAAASTDLSLSSGEPASVAVEAERKSNAELESEVVAFHKWLKTKDAISPSQLDCFRGGMQHQASLSKPTPVEAGALLRRAFPLVNRVAIHHDEIVKAERLRSEIAAALSETLPVESVAFLATIELTCLCGTVNRRQAPYDMSKPDSCDHCDCANFGQHSTVSVAP